jgi:hypothetical protein
MNERMIEALLGVGTAIVLFVPIFLVIASAAWSPKDLAARRAARLKELKKYSLRPIDLR